ncbi:PilZ domain-containing protein [Thermodesulfobacteriota bacterium]
MRQIIGVEFWQLTRKGKIEIHRYVLNCIRREFIDKLYLPPTIEIGQRRHHRVKPSLEDNVKLGLQFSPDESDIIIKEVFDISMGGAKCIYSGDYIIEEGTELELMVIFLPSVVIHCGGRIVHVITDE